MSHLTFAEALDELIGRYPDEDVFLVLHEKLQEFEELEAEREHMRIAGISPHVDWSKQ